jgi:hypothetical protein
MVPLGTLVAVDIKQIWIERFHAVAVFDPVFECRVESLLHWVVF